MFVNSDVVHTFPITLSTPPMWVQAMIVVLIGSVASIAFWEVVKYSDRTTFERQEPHLTSENVQALKNARNASLVNDLNAPSEFAKAYTEVLHNL